MKRGLLLMVVVLAFTCCEDKDIAPISEAYRLTRILNYSHLAASEPYGFLEFKYDANGNVLKESMFDYPNTLTTFREYEYENSKLKEKRIYDGQVGQLTLGSFIKYEYDKEKLVQEDLFLGDGTLQYSTFYKFDGEKLTNTYKRNNDLGIHHHYRYTYDIGGRLVLEEMFMYDQQRDGFTKHYYDDKNRLVKSEHFDHNETIFSTIEKKYSGAGELPSEELHFNEKGILTQEREFRYDNLGNLIEIIVIDSQGSNTLLKRKYNGERLIEEISYLPSFGYTEWTVTRYEYSDK